MDQITQLRQSATDGLKVANELYTKKQFDGAVSKYNDVLAANPTLADARYGLGQALEKMPKGGSSNLDTAVKQYQYYLALKTDLPQKDREKLVKLCDQLTQKSDKMKMKEKKQ